MSGGHGQQSGSIFDGMANAAQFYYRDSRRLTLIGIIWFVGILPVITVGPATVGAYSAIHSLRTDGRVDFNGVDQIIRDSAVSTTVFGVLPLALLSVAGILSWRYAETGSIVVLVATIVTFYGAVYTILVLVPTFVNIARGYPPRQALYTGISWTSSHPARSVVMILVTVALFAITAALLIAVVLVFCGLAFNFHFEVIDTASIESSPTSSG